MKINLKTLSENLVILFSLFPYVSFGIINTDSQPWILIFLSIYFIINRNFNHINIIFLWISCIFLLLILIIINATEAQLHFVLRALISYSIFFLAWFASCKIHSKRNPIIIYIISSWIYIIGGVLQVYGFDFLDWMSSNRDGGRTRGVTSFTPEPTYLGIILFLLIWILIFSLNKKDIKNNILLKSFAWTTIIINLIGIIFLSQSSMVMLWIIFSLIFLSVFFISFKNTIIGLFFFAVLFLYCYFYVNFEGWRAFLIAEQIYNIGYQGIIDIIHLDWSINVRVANVIFPIMGVWKNGLLPGGIESYGEMSTQLMPMWDYFFNRVTQSDKIWSFIGTFIYELGIFGIIILFLISAILKIENNWKIREIILIGFLLLSCVPLGVALVPLIFGSKIEKHKSKL